MASDVFFGDAYLFGYGLQVDYEQALKHYRLAAKEVILTPNHPSNPNILTPNNPLSCPYIYHHVSYISYTPHFFISLSLSLSVCVCVVLSSGRLLLERPVFHVRPISEQGVRSGDLTKVTLPFSANN